MALFGKSIDYAKDSLAEVSREAIDRAGDKLSGVVKDGVTQAGGEMRDAILHASPLCCPEAVFDQIRVDLDAHGTAARLPGGLDDDAAVAGAEIVQNVFLSDAGFRQDLRDDVVRGRHKGGVKLDVALGFRVGAGIRYGAEVQEEG